MWLKIFEFGVNFGAVIFCAAAVKLADDFLDRKMDSAVGKYNLTQIFGEGTMLYAMFFLTVAAGLNYKLSLSLFLACYVVGMLGQLDFIFPSRLSGSGESLVAIAFSLLLFGANYTLFACCVVVAIQLFDDYADCRKDQLAGQNNFANRFGEVECILLSCIFFLGAGALNAALFWPVVSGFLVIYAALFYLEQVKSA